MTQERPDELAPSDAPGSAEAASPAASHPQATVNTLRQAMRRARHDDAERMSAIADLRVARLGRLELLEDALAPLQAQIPDDVDLFDFGLMAGGQPRLFLDMIGFVEMGRDARTYRLVQTTRHGRKLLAESDSVAPMVAAITDYVARRLLDRDKALAAETSDVLPAAAPVPPRPAATVPPVDAGPVPARRPRRRRGMLGALFAFVIDLLGVITFFAIVLAAVAFAALQLWPSFGELLPRLLGPG